MARKESSQSRLSRRLGAYETESLWKKLSRKEVFGYARGYMDFLSKVKTEREAVEYFVEALKRKGFVPLKDYATGTFPVRIFHVNRGKSIYVAYLAGKEHSLRIIASHIDSPRLDVKPIFIYEDSDLVLADTHYYGGIKPYQWVNIPLSMHAYIVKKDGRSINIVFGEKKNEPRFIIADLLPHLSRKVQEDKRLKEALPAEKLDVILGSIPLKNEEASPFKLAFLSFLKKKFDLTEKDLVSAEITFTPAISPSEVGYDASLIAAYGHDDRVCAYASFTSFLEAVDEGVEKNLVLIMADKEEIGSEGVTSIKSWNFLAFLQRAFANPEGKLSGNLDMPSFLELLSNSKAISADVTAALNPLYKEVHDTKNAPIMGRGPVITKYTGSGGKYFASEATPELVAQVVSALEKDGVSWQTGELGALDMGGGGTVARYLAAYDIDVVDFGPPVLAMHSPFEIVSKADVYETHRAYLAFFRHV